MKKLLAATAAILGLCGTAQAQVQTLYVGEIITVGANFCPRYSLPAAGQLLPINANIVLFSLIGTAYGGDGVTNFALPDVKPVLTANRVPLLACIVFQGVFPTPNF